MRVANLIAVALATLLALSACKDEELERENRTLDAALREAKRVLVSEQAAYKSEIEDLKAQRHQLGEQLSQCRTDLVDAVRRGDHEATRADEAQAEVDRLRQANAEFEQKMNAMGKALVDLTAACSQMEEQASAREERVERLQKRLDESEVAAADAVRREDACESERTRLANRLLDAEERSSALERALAETTERLEAALAELDAFRRMVPDHPEPTARKSLDAKVTTVKAGENLLVLSVGSDDGVKVGDEFTVYRGNEYVAKVVVDRVSASNCIAHSVKDVEKSPIKVGDSATTKF